MTTEFAQSNSPGTFFLGRPHEAAYTYPLSMIHQDLTELVVADVPKPD
ncbi:hypothetical protein [Tsukamurella pulmonis]|nr:hypothetical protein [Tsukamurella pulmonis]